MNFTLEEELILLAVIGLVVLLSWGTTILEALTNFNDWVGKKWKEKKEYDYQPIVDLYRIWHARVAEPSLKKQAEAIKRELASLPNTRVKPIGTE